MAFRILGIRKASLSASKGTNVPKGYLAVYVGDKMRRFVIPDSNYIYTTSCVLNQHKSVASPQVLELTYFSQTKSSITMAFHIPSIRKASLSASKGTNVPKGYLAVYVGDKMRRFVIPISHNLLNKGIGCQERTTFCDYIPTSSALGGHEIWFH
ncbi:hypothetical protein AHAS_Ahas13G0137800 [Arachis hypogaea]